LILILISNFVINLHFVVHVELSAQLSREVDTLRAKTAQLEAERNGARQDLVDVHRSSMMRLRNRLVELPLIGPPLKSVARFAAARLGK